ncbi:MAG: AAA family ATPase [Firmicutes bacterium]|nr:AAA family ATPase [Bacillota bacterium]
MNIKEAKEQIKNAMKVYFSKDEFGNYAIPPEKQRPVFLMGAPGIGKTAIMEQIAQELGVGLVSYSMTHHTRQSALGLPFIVKKTYGGKEYDVSEYTMSEIIASVYDMAEETGVSEGILFLDEINCVSETLAPAMLQFLQFKTFGRHAVPKGWIVVTAGNPPEYNKSVREFDIVTWDRIKRIDVEPDFEAWKEYAYKKGIHPSILTYLEIKRRDFYKVETTVDGKSFVTARGWDDLSQMISLYEKENIAVDEKLIVQYLQHPKIAKDFSLYYDLFNKYRSDYQVDKILDGTYSEDIAARAKNAKFDERLSLLGLITDACGNYIRDTIEWDETLTSLFGVLKNVKSEMEITDKSVSELLERHIAQKKDILEKGQKASSISLEKQKTLLRTIHILEKEKLFISDITDKNEAFSRLKSDFADMISHTKEKAELAKGKLSNAFKFLEDVFPDGQELVIFVTELTVNYYSSKFISKYGCEEYFRHNKELLFYERRQEIIAELENFDL